MITTVRKAVEVTVFSVRTGFSTLIDPAIDIIKASEQTEDLETGG